MAVWVGRVKRKDFKDDVTVKKAIREYMDGATKAVGVNEESGKWKTAHDRMLKAFPGRNHDGTIFATAASNDFKAIITENVKDFELFKEWFRNNFEDGLIEHEEKGRSDTDKNNRTGSIKGPLSRPTPGPRPLKVEDMACVRFSKSGTPLTGRRV
jgi:hypothetical protein